MAKTITRRVRLDLSADVKPPYRQWLEAHAQEVMEPTNEVGQRLLSEMVSRMGKVASGSIFVTDFSFASPEHFDYYNARWLATMRGRIEEAYPGALTAGSPFRYTITTDAEPEKFVALLGTEDLQEIIRKT